MRLCAVTGVMRTCRPRALGAADLKYTRQPGLSSVLFAIMQAVMRSMFGNSDPHSRIASPLHACCSSGV
jgi:hypothetical protein